MEKNIFVNSKERLKKYCEKIPFGEEISSLDFIDKNPRFYLYYPYLFSEAFKYYDFKTLNELSIAGFFLYKSIIIKDQLLDDIYSKKFDGKHKKYIAIKDFCQDEAMKILMNLFNSKSNFWKKFQKRKMELLEEQRIENELNNNFTINEYKKLADCKSAFGKLAIDALYVLTNEQENEVYKNLLKSHKYFSTGFQLLDDSEDILIDKTNNQFNFCLNLMKDEEIKNSSDLKKLFYYKNYAIQTYTKSSFYFTKSIESLNNLDCKKWILEISYFKQNIDIKTTTLISYKKELSKRFELKNKTSNAPPFPFNKSSISSQFEILLNSILEYISYHAKNDFYEAKHIMYLSPKEGFKGRDTVYVGDVFQKAIIWDILCEVNNKLNLSEPIKYGIDDIISNRRKTRNGGWSYFPRAIENAADADTLGQILQLFVHSSNEKLIHEYCLKPISILLLDNVLKNGGIKTWIIPKRNLTKLEKIQLHFNNTKWGSGPNSDVVANFIFGLYLFDKEKFSTQILNSCHYLVTQQDKIGFWNSRWYFREFYGTYVCVRILIEHKTIFHKSLKKAYLYIKISQNKDGGWGQNNTSNPLDTSFALLSLGFFKLDTLSPIIINGIDYLLSTKKDNNSWDSVEFIKPRSIEPYKSSIITTVYVLKVFMRFQELMKNEY